MINTDRLCPGCMNDNGGEQICSICGHDATIKNGEEYLPVRFMLSDRYLIGKVISSNTESILYMAWDNITDTAVNVKEYFPKGTSARNPDKTVSVVTGSEFVFNEGLMSFIEINKKLINSELPSVIPVLSVFEENGTVYSVNSTVSGITLQSFLDKNGGALRWEQVRPLFLPLIDTVKGLHDEGIIHGGISPETILVGRDGKLRLSGICIPRLRYVSAESAAELYSGYAAAEQYGNEGMTVDFYTDVYAISAVLFRVLIGAVPPVADERMNNDTLSIPARFADEIPRQVLVALANGLQVTPQSRTANMDVFRNELVYGETKENIRRAAAIHSAEERKQKEKAQGEKAGKSKSSVRYAAISAGITAALFVVVAIVLCFTVFKDDLFPKDLPADDTSDYASMPEIESIGDYDSDVVDPIFLYTVPDLSGKYYYQILEDENCDDFKITISGKQYSDKFERGAVCSQSVDVGKQVEKDTEISVVISLGPSQVKVANVVGLDEMSAKLELLKQGFMYENIEVVEKYDSEAVPGIVLEQTPAYGESASPETVVRIYINSYKGDSANDVFD